MENFWTEIKVEDGTKMRLFVSKPRNASGAPGILVLQEAFGVNSHIRNVTERFAREGYVAVAPELFHRTAVPGFEGSYTDFPAVMPHLQAVTPTTMELDLRSAHNWLRTHSEVASERIGAIGYCMGGRAAFVANASIPLKAAVSYYGAGIAPSLLPLAEKQGSPLLLIWGGMDKHIPSEQRTAIADALSRAKKHFVEACFAEADHGFFCDERAAYHPSSARESWALTLQFLNNRLKIS